MKLKDVEVGGRYLAKVSGQLVTVRVTELKEVPAFAGDRWKIIIHAVNEATGRRITVRSPQRLRPIAAATKRIGQVDRVEQLQEGERAVPEPGMVYGLRPIDGQDLGVEVTSISRQGGAIVAHASDGRDYPVSGAGAMVLMPRSRGEHRS